MYHSELCVTCPLLRAEVKRQFDKFRQKQNIILSKYKYNYNRFNSDSYSGLCLGIEQRSNALDFIKKETDKIKSELEQASLLKKNIINRDISTQINNNCEQDTTKYNTKPCFTCKLMYEYEKRVQKNYKRKKPLELIYYQYKYDKLLCSNLLQHEAKRNMLKQIQAVIEQKESETAN